ncbi:MAG: hypothetical protein AAGG48_31305 [Planctomycetota bacterium]
MPIELIVETPDTVAGHRFLIPEGSTMSAARAAELCAHIRDEGEYRSDGVAGFGKRIHQSLRGSARTGLLKVVVSGVESLDADEVGKRLETVMGRIAECVAQLDELYVEQHLVLESPLLASEVPTEWASMGDCHTIVTKMRYSGTMRRMIMSVAGIVVVATLVFGGDGFARLKAFLQNTTGRGPTVDGGSETQSDVPQISMDANRNAEAERSQIAIGKRALFDDLLEDGFTKEGLAQAFQAYLAGSAAKLSNEERKRLNESQLTNGDDTRVFLDNLEHFSLMRHVFFEAGKSGGKGWTKDVAIASLTFGSDEEPFGSLEQEFVEAYFRSPHTRSDVIGERRRLLELAQFAREYAKEFADSTDRHASGFGKAIDGILVPLSSMMHHPEFESGGKQHQYRFLPMFGLDELQIAIKASNELKSSNDWETIFPESHKAISREIDNGNFLRLSYKNRAAMLKRLERDKSIWPKESDVGRQITILHSLVEGLTDKEFSYPSIDQDKSKTRERDDASTSSRFPAVAVDSVTAPMIPLVQEKDRLR